MLTPSQRKRLQDDWEQYARVPVRVDDTSATGHVYGFLSELGMYRIAEKNRGSKHFTYGFHQTIREFFVCIDFS